MLLFTQYLINADAEGESYYEKNVIISIFALIIIKIYYMAYYPVNGEYDFGDENMKQALKVRTNDRIREANAGLEQLASRNNIKFMNVNKNLSDSAGNLKQEYSIEGMHIYPNGYQAIFEDIMKYVRE